MLFLESVDTQDKALIKFFAQANSVESVLSGWRLALWCPRPPAALNQVNWWTPRKKSRGGNRVPIVAAFGWPVQGRGQNIALVPLDEIEVHPELIEEGQRVVLARRYELSDRIFSRLRDRLEYEPDLPQQRLGWWYDVDEDLPTVRPRWRETAGLSVEGGYDLEDNALCLLLIEAGDYWYVLSERALRTYRFSSRLADGEPLYFLRFPNEKREIWRASPAGAIDPQNVKQRFGPKLFERARDDAPSVLVKVQHEID